MRGGPGAEGLEVSGLRGRRNATNNTVVDGQCGVERDEAEGVDKVQG